MLGDLSGVSKFFIICGRTDMRKSFDGLMAIIRDTYQMDPYANAVYLFCGRDSRKIKALYFDKDGMVLATKYFEETRLSRQKSRDEALEVLQKSLKNAKISDAEKTQATEKLSRIIQDITTETDVENLVKAKGFTDCVAFISDGKISVAVQPSSGGLSKQNVAQIRDIVLSKTSIESKDIVVIEVK